MKKVLFVAHVVRLHLALFHIPYLKWFHDQGWQVDVASRNDYINKDDCIIPYVDNYYDVPFERSPLKVNNLKAYHQLKSIIDNEKYDIIHCHTPVGGVIARIAARKKKKKKTKVIYTAHGFHFYDGAPIKNWLVFYPIERFCSRYTDLLITINTEDYYRAKRFHSKRVELINGVGIDLSKFNTQPVDREIKENLRSELGLNSDDFFVITIGNLIKRKNQLTLIKAVSLAENTRLKLFICGDGEEENNLRNLINQLNLNKQVTLLGFRKDTVLLLKCADVFVFSSFQEGLPVSIMEAMACGLPVIASKIRGNVDLIDDNKGGYLVNANSAEEFAERINCLIKDDQTRIQMSDYNASKIHNYSGTFVLNQVTQLYLECMKEE